MKISNQDLSFWMPFIMAIIFAIGCIVLANQKKQLEEELKECKEQMN